MTVDGAMTTYAYNELDQLLSSGSSSLAYDPRGNLTQTSTSGDVTAYSWDALDRLSGATLPDGTALGYTYDADGRRVRQAVDGVDTNYLWDEASLYGDVVLETDAGGAPLASYVLGGGELLSQRRAGSTSYYLGDAQGSARALTNSGGVVTDTYDYTAFGGLFASTGSTTNPYLYTGQQFDAPTGLYSLRARYYDPALGRFLSRDPMEVQAFNPVEVNRYVYATDNPVNQFDPLGAQSFKSYALTTAMVGLQAARGLTDLAILAGGALAASYVLLMMAQVGVLPDLAPSYPPLPSPSPDGRDPLDEIRDLLDELNRKGEVFRKIRRVAEAILMLTLTQLLPGEPRPDQRDRNETDSCDPVAFAAWWESLPNVRASYRPGNPNYEYEQGWLVQTACMAYLRRPFRSLQTPSMPTVLLRPLAAWLKRNMRGTTLCTG